jgi:hypothetical protein
MSNNHVVVIPNGVNEYGCIPYIEGLSPFNILENNAMYLTADVFQKDIGALSGQIQRGTPFGDLIYFFASDPTGPSKWLEVGAWNGKGSTQCILDGFHAAQSDKHCISLEAHPLMFPVAQENLKTHPASSQLTLLNEVLSFPNAGEHFMPRCENSADLHYKLYYETEYVIWKSGKVVNLPYQPDAVVLDGGEYSGYIDWLALPKDNLQFVFLDDVACVKNKRVRQELLHDAKWTLLEENLKDRNGWSVFMRQ